MRTGRVTPHVMQPFSVPFTRGSLLPGDGSRIEVTDKRVVGWHGQSLGSKF